MPELYFYSPAPSLTVTLDNSGQTLTGERCTHKDREAYRVMVPQGATGGMRVSTPGFTWADSQRGLLVLPTDGNPECTFALDDIQGSATVAPPTPGPMPPNPHDPLSVIQWCLEQGEYDLSTKEGCGELTEAACAMLHAYDSPMWGHFKKRPEQNQWEGHAVDAFQCLGGPFAGGWDIIHDSVSPNASVVFNSCGPADPAIWYAPGPPPAYEAA